MSPADKQCTKCGRILPLVSFDFKNKETGTLRSGCRDCVREYSRRHYLTNRGEYIERAKLSNRDVRARKRALTAELKAGPCSDCGKTFPAYCMEFDHRDGRTITGRNSPEAITNIVRSNESFRKLREELAKCDLVCVICHRIRTHRRRKAAKVQAH